MRAIGDLGMPDRVVRVLRRNGIHTVEGLTDCDRLDLWKLRGVGAKGVKIITEAMERHGLALRGTR